MASAVIHMVVANEVNNIIKYNSDKVLIGSIAPDISKHLGESKLYSHFLDDVDNDIPNIEKFLKRYKDKLYDDFVLGYFIHLYTDYLWFKYFIPEVYENGYVTKLDGSMIECSIDVLDMYIYKDYSSLDSELLDIYDINLSIFYNELPRFDNIIKEIPMERIDIIIDKVLSIIENTEVQDNLIFNLNNIKTFIETSVELILAKLKELNIFE